MIDVRRVTLRAAFAGKPGDRVDLGHGITGVVEAIGPNPRGIKAIIKIDEGISLVGLADGKLRDLSMETVVTVERGP